jgi:lipid-binding SYLF domain-containing protein
MTRVAFGAVGVLLAAACSADGAAQDRGRRSDEDAAGGLVGAAKIVAQAREEIPPDSWGRAHCVIVVPEAGSPSGGEIGRGVMSCRSADGWTAPLFVQLTSRSRVSRGDLVLLMMHESAVARILESRVQLERNQAIVSYLRSEGPLVPVDLSGSELRADENANVTVYGRGAAPSTILASRELSAPTEAAPFLHALGRSGPGPRTDSLETGSPTIFTSGSSPDARAAGRSIGDAELRAQLTDAEQMIDRMLGNSGPSAIGTSGARPSNDRPGSEKQADARPGDAAHADTVTVERARLLQLRQQIESLLARLNRR